MGLDIRIKEFQNIVCPHCGRIVELKVADEVQSSGHEWYDFLTSIGYYVPHSQRTEENDYYGKDMMLTERQARELAKFAVKESVYYGNEVEGLVAKALLHGNKVVINADW